MQWKIENRNQLNELCGLAYHVADCEFFKERNPADLVETEQSKLHDNIVQHFESLDNLGVPMWVQNSIMNYASDWRRYKSTYMTTWFKQNKPFIDLELN